jgi:hypothetical protein
VVQLSPPDGHSSTAKRSHGCASDEGAVGRSALLRHNAEQARLGVWCVGWLGCVGGRYGGDGLTQAEAEALLGFRVTPGWVFHEIKRGGVLAGFVMQLGAELHVFRLPGFAGRWLMREEIDRILTATIAEHGKATTKTTKQNTTGQKFIQRLGFRQTADDGQILYYECERPRHARL